MHAARAMKAAAQATVGPERGKAELISLLFQAIAGK
jgi:hypothetical protein